MSEHSFDLSFKALRDFSFYRILLGERQGFHEYFIKVCQGVLGKDGISTSSLQKTAISIVNLKAKLGKRGISLLRGNE